MLREVGLPAGQQSSTVEASTSPQLLTCPARIRERPEDCFHCGPRRGGTETAGPLASWVAPHLS